MTRRAPEEELRLLRISIARMAQTAGVESEQLPVLAMSYDELAVVAKTQDDGWNHLVGLVMGKIEELQRTETRYHELCYKD